MKTYKSKPDAVVDLLAIITNVANETFGVIEHINFSDTIEDVSELYGADSIDIIELIMLIEDELEIEIPELDVVESFNNKTVSQLIDYLLEFVKIVEPLKVAPAAKFGIKISNGGTTVDISNDGSLNVSSSGPVTITADSLTQKNSKLTSTPTANDAVGILWMPSLEWHGRLFKIEGVTMAEAIEHMNDYAVKATKKRKTKEFKPTGPDFQHSEFFVNVINTDSFPQEVLDDPRYFNKDIMSMMESMVPQTRGLRPLFLAHNVIGIGTTVVYNKNWATLHFEDTTALDRLLHIQDKYEEVEDEEESSYEESSDSYND